jgi:adenylate cyclase
MERTYAFSKSLEAARTAVALDPKSPEAHTQLGYAHRVHMNLDLAKNACETAIQLNPNYEQSYTLLGMINLAGGNPEEALIWLNKSLRRSQRLPTAARRYFFIGWAHLLAGHYEESIAACKKAITASPKFSFTYWVLASASAWAGRMEEAQAALAKFNEVDKKLVSIEKMKQLYKRAFKNMETAYEGLRKAGMPDK